MLKPTVRSKQEELPLSDISNITQMNNQMKIHDMKQINLMSWDDDDNMRGWDPASEDDMEDNGMERWSENNDERGWD